MRKGWRAVTSGAVGTFVMTVLLLIVDVQTRTQFSLFEALARLFQVPDRVGLGFLVFIIFGVVVWPLLFAVLEGPIPPEGDSAVTGMIFAAVLWGGFVLLGTTEINWLLLPFYLVVTLLTHLAYGFTMGLVYGWTPLQPNVEAHNTVET